MGRGEAQGDVPRDGNGPFGGKRTLRHESGQGLAIQVFGDEIEVALKAPHVVNGQQVRMAEIGHESGFPLEPGLGLRIFEPAGSEGLDGLPGAPVEGPWP